MTKDIMDSVVGGQFHDSLLALDWRRRRSSGLGSRSGTDGSIPVEDAQRERCGSCRNVHRERSGRRLPDHPLSSTTWVGAGATRTGAPPTATAAAGVPDKIMAQHAALYARGRERD